MLSGLQDCLISAMSRKVGDAFLYFTLYYYLQPCGVCVCSRRFWESVVFNWCDYVTCLFRTVFGSFDWVALMISVEASCLAQCSLGKTSIV